MGKDAHGRRRNTALKFEEMEQPEYKIVWFKADIEMTKEFDAFCKEVSISKSAFLRYAARKGMLNFLRSE